MWGLRTSFHKELGSKLRGKVHSGSPAYFDDNAVFRPEPPQLGTFVPPLRSNMVVNAVRRATVAGALVGIGVLVVVGGYLRFWRPLIIDEAALLPRPPQAVEPPRWDDGSPRDVPCSSNPPPGAEPISVGLCDLVSRPQEFACRRVRFRATLGTDCIHSTALEDSRCERGIAPDISLTTEPRVESFFETACAERSIDFDVKRSATFTGYFRLRERNAATIFILDIESVRGIKISPGPQVIRSHSAGLYRKAALNGIL